MKFQTINGWTKEKMKVAIRAGNNGKRAFDPQEHVCRYLTPDGNRCAVGCFLPDGHPGQSYEGTTIGLLNEYPELKKKMPLSPEALRRLQKVHDSHISARDALDMRDVLCEWIDKNVEDGK